MTIFESQIPKYLKFASETTSPSPYSIQVTVMFWYIKDVKSNPQTAS